MDTPAAPAPPLWWVVLLLPVPPRPGCAAAGGSRAAAAAAVGDHVTELPANEVFPPLAACVPAPEDFAPPTPPAPTVTLYAASADSDGGRRRVLAAAAAAAVVATADVLSPAAAAAAPAFDLCRSTIIPAGAVHVPDEVNVWVTVCDPDTDTYDAAGFSGRTGRRRSTGRECRSRAGTDYSGPARRDVARVMVPVRT